MKNHLLPILVLGMALAAPADFVSGLDGVADSSTMADVAGSGWTTVSGSTVRTYVNSDGVSGLIGSASTEVYTAEFVSADLLLADTTYALEVRAGNWSSVVGAGTGLSIEIGYDDGGWVGLANKTFTLSVGGGISPTANGQDETLVFTTGAAVSGHVAVRVARTGTSGNWGGFDTVTLRTSLRHSFRIMSYNIYHGEDANGVNNLDLTASVIAAAHPDLVALQEVDKNTDRSGHVDQAAELGEALGMEYRFGKAMDYQGGEYGVAILSRFPIHQTFHYALPTPLGSEPRCALEVQVQVPDIYGRTNLVSFLSTHLDHRSNTTRVDQVATLVEALGSRDHAVVLCGDLNATPLEDPIELLKNSGYAYLDTQDLWTFPAIEPNRKIDYVLVRTKELPLASVPVRVVDERVASDHRPILAELSLGAPADWLAHYGLPQDDRQSIVDSDGDSFDDYSEWRAGTVPTNVLSYFDFIAEGTRSVPTGYQLQWNSITNRSYRIEVSTNLMGNPSFAVLKTGVPGMEGTTEFIDIHANEKEQAYYRIHVE